MPFHRAVARVTSEPARWFNLDGGCIKAGVKADLVVLNPEKLRTSIPSPSLHVDSVLRGASRMVKRDDEAAVSAVFINGNEVVRAGAPLPNSSEQQHGDVLLQVNRTGSQQEASERYRNRISFDS
ncbi:hypothetical protein OY671_012064, partial [Metschnikowia pulcherrima]